MTAKLSSSEPEFDLILACLRTGWKAEATEEVRALVAKSIDWRRLWDLVIQEGLWMPVTRTLLADSTLPLPRALAIQWKKLHARAQYQSRKQAVAAAQAVDILQQAGVPALVVKGVALEKLAYDAPGWRGTSDIDLLIDSSSFKDAERALFDAGYDYPGGQAKEEERTAQALDANAKRHIKEVYLCLFGERAYIRENVTIDLHVRPLDRRFTFRTSFESLYQRHISVEVDDVVLPTLSREDALIYSACHGFANAWRLKYIVDVAQLVARGEIDWELLLRQAASYGVYQVLQFALGEAAFRLSVPLPDEIQAEVDQGSWQQRNKWLSDRGHVTSLNGFLYRLKRYLAFQDDLSAGGRLLWYIGLQVGLYNPLIAIRRHWTRLVRRGLTFRVQT